MGLDMGYNKSHHTEEATEVSVHAHGDGKKHLHNKKEKKVLTINDLKSNDDINLSSLPREFIYFRLEF